MSLRGKSPHQRSPRGHTLSSVALRPDAQHHLDWLTKLCLWEFHHKWKDLFKYLQKTKKQQVRFNSSQAFYLIIFFFIIITIIISVYFPREAFGLICVYKLLYWPVMAAAAPYGRTFGRRVCTVHCSERCTRTWWTGALPQWWQSQSQRSEFSMQHVDLQMSQQLNLGVCRLFTIIIVSQTGLSNSYSYKEDQ